ncbi:MAG: glutamate/gamma-aminobutyrate family transporter YjeM [Acetilactobacillus jinshanensis]
MNNVCTGLQYVLIILAFPFFKNLSNLKRPFTIYHSIKII